MVKKRLDRTQMVPVRLEKEALRALDILALKQNRYRSELIREAVQDLIKKHKALEKTRL